MSSHVFLQLILVVEVGVNGKGFIPLYTGLKSERDIVTYLMRLQSTCPLLFDCKNSAGYNSPLKSKQAETSINN